MSFYVPIILFFSSLIGIVFMLSKKLVLVKEGDLNPRLNDEEPGLELDLDKVKKESSKQLKRVGYIMLFVTMRFSIKLAHFTKTKSMLIWNKLKDKRAKQNPEDSQNKEVSKYLRNISEYRSKLRHLKHKIKEEEGIE